MGQPEGQPSLISVRLLSLRLSHEIPLQKVSMDEIHFSRFVSRVAKHNVQGAVAEAGFMTGMERNSDIVKLASYAPLFVHTENRGWPTNMIVFDNHRLAASPDAYPPSMIAFDNHRCACFEYSTSFSYPEHTCAKDGPSRLLTKDNAKDRDLEIDAGMEKITWTAAKCDSCSCSI